MGLDNHGSPHIFQQQMMHMRQMDLELKRSKYYGLEEMCDPSRKKMKKQKEKEVKKKKSRVTIEKIKRKKYSEEVIQKALDAIKNGMPKKKASKQFQVPRATLQFRIKKPDHKPQPGPNPVLNFEEENKLKNWLNVSHAKSFPKRKEDLLNSVSEFIKKSGRPNPFKNNVPGEKWFKLFLKRHPDIAIRTPEAITAASAAVSANDIKGWFQAIETYLKENGLFEILPDPKRVFNGDETNFLLCAKTDVVLAPKGAKNVFEVDHAPAKTSLTVMFTFAANGEITPPMVIFPYKRLPREIASKVPSDWGIGLSDNGWMKTEIFSQYIEKVLHPHLMRNEVPFPVILFVDGHKTHLTYAVSELCSSLDIVLIALYPNCTRLLQPADVSAFRPLKGGWQQTVLEWRRDNPSRALTKVDFVPLLQKTIEKSVKQDTIINGFRTTGLCPWNSEAIDYSKCLGKNLKNKPENELKPKSPRVMKKQDFIKYVGMSKITDLKNKHDLTDAEKILRKLWYFFDGSEDEQTNVEEQEERKTNEISNKNGKDNDGNKQTCETNTPDTLKEQNLLDIANMDVILCDDFDSSCNIPLGQEVLIEEISQIGNEEDITAENDLQTDFLPENIENNDFNITADDTQTNNWLEVMHTVQVETCKDRNDFRIDNSLNQPISKSYIHPIQDDFDKIEILDMENNPTFSTPVKTNLREIKLDDVLVLPKTPQRKGVRNTKKTSFVITSEEFKAEERKKIKAKKEKEEGIQKRKEERLQKKLTKTEKKQKKEKKSVKKDQITDSVKRTLLLEDLSNKNNNVTLNNEEKTNDKDKEELIQEQEKEKDEDKVKLIQEQEKQNNEMIQERNDKAKRKINKENYISNKPKQNINFNSIKIKEEKCDTKNKIKIGGGLVQVVLPEKVPNKLKKEDTKSVIKNILCSEEALSDTDDDERSEYDHGRARPNQKFSVTEIEKMLTDV